MSERDYLFDKEGEPDPEIARLEGLLAPLAYRGAPPLLPARIGARRPYVVAAAALAMAAAIAALVIARPWRPAPKWIDSDARVELAIGDIGRVELAPHTRARVVAGGPAPHTLELVRGTLHAVIDAPPRQFAVVTPHAVVTDLGCVFDVIVDEAGRGQVVVRKGRVGVAGAGAAEIVVPAGARVELTEHGAGELHGPEPMPTQSTPARPTAPRPTPSAPSQPGLQPAPSTPGVQPAPSTPGVQPAPSAAHGAHHATHATHKTHAPAHPIATKTPGKAAPVAAPTRAPAKKPTKDDGLHHDPLEELQRSVE